MAISQYALAKAIGVPPRRINEIGKGWRGITVDTALRLSVLLAPMRKAGAICKPTTTRNMPALPWLAYWAASCVRGHKAQNALELIVSQFIANMLLMLPAGWSPYSWCSA